MSETQNTKNEEVTPYGGSTQNSGSRFNPSKVKILKFLNIFSTGRFCILTPEKYFFVGPENSVQKSGSTKPVWTI